MTVAQHDWMAAQLIEPSAILQLIYQAQNNMDKIVCFLIMKLKNYFM
ncbi:hypothetical protein [Salmonella enterica]|nr:hypothetical protein [Salmonella enterica]